MVPAKMPVDAERFRDGAEKYAAYLETPEGRLRADLTFANLQEFLLAGLGRRVLDLGCGTGATAVRLAQLGFQVTMLDSAPAMLEIAERTAREAGVTDSIFVLREDAANVAKIFQDASFDLVICHNLLEYLEKPQTVVRGIARTLRDSGILSVLVRNQAGEVMKAAIKNGDLGAAEDALGSEWGEESLYGGKVRLFTPQSAEQMLTETSLAIAVRRGVRVLADYLPAQLSRSAEYERILALERALGKRQEFFGIARYLHYMARL
jgi:S-adenosylmethionine-dependent methyltransferase